MNLFWSHHRYFFRVVTFILLITFLSFDVSWAQGPRLPLQAEAAAGGVLFPDIPHELGSVEQISLPGEKQSSPIIYHIQDAHAVLDAQKSLAQIIELLIQKEKISTIFVEGGSGDVSLDALRKFAPRSIRKEVAERFLDNGKISGEEYLELSTDYPIKLIGIEDKTLYEENLKTFLIALRRKKAALNTISQIESMIRSLEVPNYSKEFREMIEFKKDSEKGIANLLNYVQLLEARAKEKGIDTQINPEWQKLIAFKGQVPLQSFDRKRFFEELGGIEKRLGESYLETDQSRKLWQISEDLELLKRLFSLELSPSDYESIQKDNARLDVVRLIKSLRSIAPIGLKTPSQESISYLQKELPCFLKFYELAKKRDQVFIRNMTRDLTHRKGSRFILITGGFHSEALSEAIKREGHGYARISPAIGNIEKDQSARYEEMIKEKLKFALRPPATYGTPVYLELEHALEQTAAQRLGPRIRELISHLDIDRFLLAPKEKQKIPAQRSELRQMVLAALFETPETLVPLILAGATFWGYVFWRVMKKKVVLSVLPRSLQTKRERIPSPDEVRKIFLEAIAQKSDPDITQVLGRNATSRWYSAVRRTIGSALPYPITLYYAGPAFDIVHVALATDADHYIFVDIKDFEASPRLALKWISLSIKNKLQGTVSKLKRIGRNAYYLEFQYGGRKRTLFYYFGVDAGIDDQLPEIVKKGFDIYAEKALRNGYTGGGTQKSNAYPLALKYIREGGILLTDFSVKGTHPGAHHIAREWLRPEAERAQRPYFQDLGSYFQYLGYFEGTQNRNLPVRSEARAAQAGTNRLRKYFLVGLFGLTLFSSLGGASWAASNGTETHSGWSREDYSSKKALFDFTEKGRKAGPIVWHAEKASSSNWNLSQYASKEAVRTPLVSRVESVEASAQVKTVDTSLDENELRPKKDLGEKVAQYETALDEFKAKEGNLRTKIESLQEEGKQLRKKFSEAQKTIDEKKETLNELQKTFDEIEKTLSSVKGEANSNAERAQALGEENERLQKELASLKESGEKLKQDLEKEKQVSQKKNRLVQETLNQVPRENGYQSMPFWQKAFFLVSALLGIGVLIALSSHLRRQRRILREQASFLEEAEKALEVQKERNRELERSVREFKEREERLVQEAKALHHEVIERSDGVRVTLSPGSQVTKDEPSKTFEAQTPGGTKVRGSLAEGSLEIQTRTGLSGTLEKKSLFTLQGFKFLFPPESDILIRGSDEVVIKVGDLGFIRYVQTERTFKFETEAGILTLSEGGKLEGTPSESPIEIVQGSTLQLMKEKLNFKTPQGNTGSMVLVRARVNAEPPHEAEPIKKTAESEGASQRKPRETELQKPQVQEETQTQEVPKEPEAQIHEGKATAQDEEAREETLRKAEAELEEVRKAKVQAEQARGKALEAQKQAEEKRDEALGKLQETLGKIQEAETLLGSVRTETETLHSVKETLLREIEALKSEHNALLKSSEAAQSKLDELKASYEEVKLKLDSTQKASGELETRRKMLEEPLRNLENKIAQNEEKLSSQENQIQE